ncbi:hypothetical protein MGH68_18525 [Erysipelothrix sp. D19-032]
MNDNYTLKLNRYLDLFELEYDKVVEVLQKKYGEATEDYFNEVSYNNFISGKNKSPNKGQTSRTDEGLFCHHVDENIYKSISEPNLAKIQRIPFSSQSKSKLVYCDLFEHAILHAIISKETDGNFGKQGLEAHLFRKLKQWYLNLKYPRYGWWNTCYIKSYLNEHEAEILLIRIAELQMD